VMKRVIPTPVAAVISQFVILLLVSLSLTAATQARASSGGLKINEVMASNSACLADPQGEFDDWIEICNVGDAPVDVGGLWLSDDPGELARWQFPSTGPLVIEPNGFLIVWADGETADAGLHASFRLDSSGEEVCLLATDGITLIDRLAFGRQDSDISFGRYPDAADTLRYFAEPTPGRPNSEGYAGEVAPLRFSHERGFYDGTFNLTITTATEDAQILYTTDGRVPNDPGYRALPGQPYSGPIPVTKTTCVRAMAIKPGWKPTEVYTHTYIIDTRQQTRSLPIISLVGDPATTFYEPSGVMAIVGGTYNGGVWTSTGSGSYNNVLDRNLERPVSAEWVFPDEEDDFQIDCGLRVHGSAYTRPRYVRQNGVWSGTGKFGFRLYFRGEYGQSRLQVPLFAESVAEQFATIVLRAGHNDEVNPFIKDELLRRLHKDMGQVACMGTFAQLYVNGQYKGYYNPTEHIKQEACQEWFHSDKSWDVMTMNGIRDGDTQSWNAMLAYARSHDLSNPAYYDEMCGKLDVVCFIDYLIIRLWPNDWDWPQNNWAAVCERSEAGRWKFFVWDAEGTFETNQLQLDRFPEFYTAGNANNPNAVLYRALMASDDFRRLFADRLYKHFYNGGALTTENVRRRFTEMQNELRGFISNMNTYTIDTWVPNRLSVFFNACVREGVYTFDGPTFTVNGVTRHGGHVSAADPVQLVSARPEAPIYYTLDGTDPAQARVPSESGSVTLVPVEAPKRVVVSSRGSVGDWRGAGPFDDSLWTLSTGLPGGIGYERGTGYESYITTDVGERMYGLNASCFIRIPFSVDVNKNRLKTMTLRMQYDDGFVAYLNGVEIARRNAEGQPTWNSTASASRSDADAVFFEPVDVSSQITRLQQGDNVLAIQGLNVSTTSSDFLIAAELSATYDLPASEPAASASAMLFADPIQLTRSAHVKARARSGGIWSALAEAAFAVGPVAQSLRISELMYHPADPNAEYVELTNVGAETIDLNLVRFTDGIEFVFPPWALEPGGCCLVVQDIAAFQARYGDTLPCVGQYTGSLDNAGERIELQDAAGTRIAAFEFRDDWYDITDGAGYSLTVRDPGTDDPNDWGDASAWRPSAAVGGSPGFDDGMDAAEPVVVISELLANATGGACDWIELHNTTDQAVDIGGWYLSDDSDDPAKYEIAAGTVIEPRGYLLLTEDLNFGNVDEAGCHTPFALSQDGETLYLYSASGGMLTGHSDRVKFGASEPGVTFGRYPLSTGDSDFAATSEPTPGGPNAAPRIGPVVIREIMYHPDGPANAEYIELYNTGAAEVTLYDAATGAPWRLTDGARRDGLDMLFPADPPVTLAAGEYLLLVRDRLLCGSQYVIGASLQILEWGLGRLDDAGGTIVLSRPGRLDKEGVRDWICIDRVAYSDGSHPQSFAAGVDPWPVDADGRGSSLARISLSEYGNDPNNWQAATPSLGAAKRLGGR
jgi:hypothetical protein